MSGYIAYNYLIFYVVLYSTTIAASSSSSSASSKYRELTTDEISTLQLAFSTFYNTGSSGNRLENVMKSYELFTKAIHIWESTEQSGDEIAGLFRVRGDVNMVRTVYIICLF